MISCSRLHYLAEDTALAFVPLSPEQALHAGVLIA